MDSFSGKMEGFVEETGLIPAEKGLETFPEGACV